ncbi:85/88 kDa calcium-independent phospholipase A2-like protein [Leptotrombidium deliense]|uniref:85/88 kDa calcium-independent phospholipase A2-like protein n=1 Tax=Leptotrombidium deliense TaxID=299467 RepID=A0A443RWK0_9ACAR|nr:85/88 kDa calcium-independent phospholipase A2-like protein [Leptotrombidium deliense]
MNCFFNGTPIDASPFNRVENICDSLLSSLIVDNAVSAKQKYFTNGDVMEIDKTDDRNIRLLCLDGGGIRGLILIQMLSVLEEVVRLKVGDCFDWIAGTSTGGILALYIALGNSASECRKLYFRLKDKVFVGSRPYDSEPLEKFLREALGEETKMSDIQKPKVMVTATVADQFPADMHTFRNYTFPEDIVDESKGKFNKRIFHKPCDQLVWMAARSSGAAPTYFRPCGSFLDGGLISNNPTLDALTEIIKYNASLDAIGKSNEKYTLRAVVSLGTGSIPVTQVPIIDIFRPDSLFGVAKMAFMASSLGQLLIDQMDK